MFKLYKERNFSSLINDTFTFFKSEGKNFFRNYFILNGALMAILILLVFIVFRIFFQNIFITAGSPGSTRMMDAYFDSNEGFFAGAAIFSGILLLLLTLTSYSFPVLYLKLTETGNKPTSAAIWKLFRKRFGRVILFGLLSLITFVPIIIFIALLAFFMMALIITIPLAIILVAAVSCWISLAFYDYLNTDNGYFSAMRNSFYMLFKNFWAHMGSTAIFYIMISVVQSILSLIPYIIGIVILLTDVGTEGQPNSEQFGLLGTLILITFLLSIVLSYVLGNFLFVNQGMIYYSCREQDENHSLHSEIDLIGKDFD